MDIALVILAAGRSRRFGKMKQIEPVGPNGEILLEYTLFDAIRIGFKKIVLVTNDEILPVLKNKVDNVKIGNDLDIAFVLQDLPPGRNKPWGTGHAVLSARKEIENPFAVVNGDDFYGLVVLKKLYQSLACSDSEGNVSFLLGYRLGNTLSEHGENARGLCEIDNEGFLTTIIEHTNIFKTADGIFHRRRNNRLQTLFPDTVVSMNCWSFPETFFTLLEPLFTDFKNKHQNDSEIEFFLPSAINRLMSMKKMRVKVMVTEQQWFGITYEEDSRHARNNINHLITQGIYPNCLW